MVAVIKFEASKSDGSIVRLQVGWAIHPNLASMIVWLGRLL